MSYFDGIKVGDRVWSVAKGGGKCFATDAAQGLIHVDINGECIPYTWGGIRIGDTLQTLFWDEVKIIPPPKPKRVVKREMEVMFDRDMDSPCVWASNDTCGPAPHNCVTATITWEEPE